MLTFFELAYMLMVSKCAHMFDAFLGLAHLFDATQIGFFGVLTFLDLAHMFDATQIGFFGMLTFLDLAQGEFSRNQSRGCWPKLQIHTGTVDSIWQNIKDWVPNSLCAHRSGKVNSSLMTYCRQWQWRNAHVLCKDLMATTGKALKR